MSAEYSLQANRGLANRRQGRAPTGLHAASRCMTSEKNKHLKFFRQRPGRVPAEAAPLQACCCCDPSCSHFVSALCQQHTHSIVQVLKSLVDASIRIWRCGAIKACRICLASVASTLTTAARRRRMRRQVEICYHFSWNGETCCCTGECLARSSRKVSTGTTKLEQLENPKSSSTKQLLNAHAAAVDAQTVIIHSLKLPMRGCPLSRQCGCDYFGHDKRHGKSCDPRQRGAACAPTLIVTELRTAGFLARRGVSTVGRPTLRLFGGPALLQQISTPANVSQLYTTNAICVIARHHTVSRMHTSFGAIVHVLGVPVFLCPHLGGA